MNQPGNNDSSGNPSGPARVGRELYARGNFAKELSNVGGLPDLLSTCGEPRPFATEAVNFSDPIPLLQSGNGLQLDFLNSEHPDQDAYGELTVIVRYVPATIMRPSSDVTATVISAREGFISSGLQMHNRAPAPSLGRYTGLLAVTSWDPMQYAPPCKILAVHLYFRSTRDQRRVNIVKLSTLDAELRAGTAQITDHVLLDLSSLGAADLGRLVKFGSNVVDASDTHEGVYTAIDSPRFDPVLDQVVSDSLSASDREFCMFMCALPLACFEDQEATIILPQYNLVDHAVSLFSPRPTAFFPRDRSRGSLIRYARVLKTLFIQTAALRYGVFTCIGNSHEGPAGFEHLESLFSFNIQGMLDGEMAWIPYELVPFMGGRDLSQAQTLVGGVRGNKVENKVHVPRSVIRRRGVDWRDVAYQQVTTTNPYLGDDMFAPLTVYGNRGQPSTIVSWRMLDEPENRQVGHWGGVLSTFREI